MCRFEGENTSLELARKLAAGQDWKGIHGLAYRDDLGLPQFPHLRQRITDLGTLPFPTRTYLPQILAADGVIQIEASRACNAECTFCDVRMTGWVPRPVEHFVDEMEQLTNQFPGHQFWIVDNIFIGFGKERFERAKQLAEEIKHRDLQVQFTFQDRAENMRKEVLLPLKQAGLNKVYLGIESFAQTFLDRIKKKTAVETNIQALLNLRDLGIFTQMGYLVFDEGTTMAEIKESLGGLRTVVQNNGYLHIHNFNELIPYAGTYLERRYEEKYGYKPDPNSDQIWKFPEPEVRTYRDLVWQYLTRVWPVTEIIFHNFDNPQVYEDLPKFLPIKNQLFVDYFDFMHQAVLRNDKAAELQQLCDDWVNHTKTTLSPAIERWHHKPTYVDLADAVARIK